MARLLLIDSNLQTSFILKRTLEKHHHSITIVASINEAIVGNIGAEFDIALLDLKSIESEKKTFDQEICTLVSVFKLIVLSPIKDIKVGIDLMKIGAKDYLQKPINSETLLKGIENLLAVRSSCNAIQISSVVKPSPISTTRFIKGTSAIFQAVLHQIERVSPTNYSVIIYGESGSGKELVAQEIHKQSKRNKLPFVAIDCGALSRELASSDLFGHEKGAFTGAHSQKIGNFEVANGGTIFLDEVANLPYEVQVSLLRVVQERKFRRLGGTRDIDFDARIIVATNEPLWDSISKIGKRFREDLFHRFNEFDITVPPLRERKEDISLLALHFLAAANHDLNKNIIGFTMDVYELFKTYFWHGNIRELNNIVRRSALLTSGDYIETVSLPMEILNWNPLALNTENLGDEQPAKNSLKRGGPEAHESQQPIRAAAINAEYKVILKVLTEVKFNKAKAAKILNIDRKTLYNKLDGFSSAEYA
jgi:two-component system response regulator HydG